MPDADALGVALSELQPVLLDAVPSDYQPVQTPSGAQIEQSLCSVIVAAPAGTLSSGGLLGEEVVRGPAGLAPLALDGSHTVDEVSSSHSTLRSSLSRYGADVERLVDGSLFITIVQNTRMTATDLATQAARCALLIHEHSPTALVALATGKALVGGRRLPTGEALDRVGRMLAVAALSRGGSDRPGGADIVLIDEVTAGLLDARFTTQLRGAEGIALIGERTSVDESRPLLGKPTPCIGREVELLQLEAVFNECRDEPMASAVVVIGQPGMGKSRLRHEFVRRLESRGDEVTLLLGRGEPLSAQTAYGLLGQAMRRLCGVLDGEAATEQQAKFLRRFGQQVAPAEVPRVAAFLGELAGVPFPEDTVAQLRAARLDPNRMSDEIRRAMLEFLSAECAARPVLWVLEDLHWSDGLTVRLIDAVLRDLRERPLMILALGRPEVRDLFPKLWEGRRTQSFDLKGLSKKASEKLANQVLGAQITRETLARIVAQAEGNALFLEELIRATAEGKGDDLPATLLAMLQARLGRMMPEVRSVLRAASVFGEAFWQGGVAALRDSSSTSISVPGGRPGSVPGSSPSSGGGSKRPSSGDAARRPSSPSDDKPRVPTLDPWLRVLLTEEVIERQPTSRFPSEIEFRFRHALVREAAYSLLTPEDRRIEHQRAARYLVRMGEVDPLVIAEHYRRGGELEQTVPLYLRAGDDASRMWAMAEARQHFASAYDVLDKLPSTPDNDRCRIDVLLRQARSGLLAEPPELHLARMAEARALLEKLDVARQPADEKTAEALADRRRSGWIDFVCGRVHYYQGRPAESIACCKAVLPVAEELHDEQLLAMPSQLIGAVLLTQGEIAKCRPLLARAVSLQDRLDNDFERLRAQCYYAISLVTAGFYREGMALHDQTVARAAESRQPAALAAAHMFRCCAYRVCGDFPRFLTAAQDCYEAAQKSGERVYEFVAGSMIGWAHGLLGNVAEARQQRSRAQKISVELGGRLVLSDWLSAGDIEVALRAGELERAVELGENQVPLLRKEGRLLALGVAEQGLGLALWRIGRREEAEAHLRAALDLLEKADQHFGAAVLRLEWAALCRRSGETGRASALRALAVAHYEDAGCAHLVGDIERQTLTA